MTMDLLDFEINKLCTIIFYNMVVGKKEEGKRRNNLREIAILKNVEKAVEYHMQEIVAVELFRWGDLDVLEEIDLD